MTILDFGPNFPQKSISSLNRKSEHYHGTLLIRNSLVTKKKKTLADSFDDFDQTCTKRVFPVEKKKSEHHH